MPDKFNIAGVEFVLPADNTKVSPSTLPVGPTSKGPNLARGRDEYNKGNYLDSDAKAYAENISGKVNSVSPEFDLLTFFGIKTFAQATKAGLGWLYKGYKNFVDDPIKYSVRDKINRDIYSNYLKLSNNISSDITLPNGTIVNAPIEQSKQYTLKRTTKYLEKQYGKSEKDLVSGTNHTVKEYIKDSTKPINWKDTKRLDERHNKYNFEIDNSKSSPGILSARTHPVNRKGYIVYDDVISSPARTRFTNNSKQTGIMHEINHLIDRLYGKIRNPEGFATKEELFNILSNNKYKNINIRNLASNQSNILEYGQRANDINYFLSPTELSARGTQLKNYFGFTNPDQVITGDMLKYAAKNYIKDTGVDNNMREFFLAIKDWDKAAKWLSENSLEKGGKIK